MHYYRDVFPEASIKPKLHILEDHMVNFCGTAGLDVVFLVNRALKVYIKYITN